ncbi:MAG: uracil-DNA glycosylase [Phycisphaerae bacterium]|nr:uracil-DNA glycosylase [Phycisphaerae bacterium]
MTADHSIDITKALKQVLETEAFLGAKYVPVSPGRIAEIRAAGARGVTASEGAAARHVESRPTEGTAIRMKEKAEALRKIDEDEVRGCVKCHLSATRTQTVFGQGDSDARIVFVGEAPGFEEDRQGVAFIGKAGQLLTAMIEKGMGLKREDVFICNVLKCRPPNNRTPSTDEIAACSPYLFRQLQLIQPEVIIALGAPAAQTLLGTKESIGRLRGRFHDFYPSGAAGMGDPVPLMPTYHPAYLLRSPGEKRKAWEDLKMVMDRLGLPVPGQYR